jgi:hypothetical protein
MNRREAIAAIASLPGLTRISSETVQPTDVIVLECPGRITSEVRERLIASLRTLWPLPQKIVVLEQGIQMKVLK